MGRDSLIGLAEFCNRPALEVAPGLIGARLCVDGAGGVIVEAEAYAPDEPASHSFNGPTPRNGAMFGPAGTAYVYRCYGIHWCFNIVCEPGSAVLIRAVEPKFGLAAMAERRGLANPKLLCAGPGRLCQAMGIGIEHNALPLDRPPFRLEPGGGKADVVRGTRIGISEAVDLPWRFGLRESPFLSRRFAT